ncbi:PREDICTED: uncharacterized protein LOC109146979 [Ipomoea nil]|uniref:uncharacterized protein LOC109146979 n=1 Tax=Ipomoea nil TaxID=35883 RepID=UPI000900A037|nr:PREDICTED: uncharacterized protein LOC109146979 [Ipomoea nil]
MEKDHANRSKQHVFSLAKFDDWKIRMQALLCSIHDEMWDVITTGRITVMTVNTQAAAQGAGAEQMIPKPKDSYTSEERTRANLDNVARNILYNSLDDSLFPRVRKCKNAMEIWNVLMELGEGDEQEKDNKLTVAMKKFEDFKMLPNETIMDMELRFTRLMGDLTDLGKELAEKERNLKILRGLPKSWEMKVIAMRDSRDMKTMSTAKIFSDLKAYEFEHEPKDAEESETRNVALVANQSASTSNRKMKRFMRKNNFQDSHRSGPRKQHESSPQTSKAETSDSQLLCYNCQKPGHFKANCPHPIVSKHQDSNTAKAHPRRLEIDTKEMTSQNHQALETREEGRQCQESEDMCLMADEDEVNSHSSFCYSAESSSVGSQTSNESVTEMMRRFKVINSTYSKLKEENSQLMISYNALRQVRIENIMLAIAKEQLEKNVLALKEQHMTGDKSMLSNFIEVDGHKVIFGGENSGRTRGKGDIIKKGITIQDVSYVEGLKFNLLSTSQFCDKGYKVEFSKDECKIVNTKDGKTALTGVSYTTTEDHLRAFDERADEGLFMGYSSVSKAFRVQNKRTMVIEESIHVKFDEQSEKNPPDIKTSNNSSQNNPQHVDEEISDEEDILSSYMKYQLKVSEPEPTTQEKVTTQQNDPAITTTFETMVYIDLPYIPEMDVQNQQDIF